MITASQVISEGLQIDGRRYVTIQFTDDLLGTWFEVPLVDAGVTADSVRIARVTAWDQTTGLQNTYNITCEDSTVVTVVLPSGSGQTVNFSLVPTSQQITAMNTTATYFTSKVQPLMDRWESATLAKQKEIMDHCPRLVAIFRFFGRYA